MAEKAWFFGKQNQCFPGFVSWVILKLFWYLNFAFCLWSSKPVSILSCADDDDDDDEDDDGCDDDNDGCDDDDHYLQVFGEVQSVAVTSVTTSSAEERAHPNSFHDDDDDLLGKNDSWASLGWWWGIF